MIQGALARLAQGSHSTLPFTLCWSDPPGSNGVPVCCVLLPSAAVAATMTQQILTCVDSLEHLPVSAADGSSCAFCSFDFHSVVRFQQILFADPFGGVNRFHHFCDCDEQHAPRLSPAQHVDVPSSAAAVKHTVTAGPSSTAEEKRAAEAQVR